MKCLTLIFTVLTLASPAAIGAKKDRNHEQKVDIKCYVSLYTGAKTIVNASIRKKQIPSLPSNLTGRAMLTPLSDERLVVYKVYECVELSKKFKSAEANRLFEKTPR